jgi:Histidine kinase-, DNA gyrase B-, and HSP90-like ATPase
MPKSAAPTDEEITRKINDCINRGGHFDAPLETDERVLARVADGIYRQPASALRELIANGYDADATIVSVTTDAPRFGTIKVSDDGIGMTPEALTNLVRHIGGSAKRTQRGPALGVTAKQDPTRSAGRRRLIGKIGIGLFSVAQLTRQFVITTKTKGADYQLIAHVTLNWSDEAAELAKVDASGKHPFQAGTARIWAEKTPDKKGHGTSIRLISLLPRVVHLLQSRDTWAAVDAEERERGSGKRQPPLFHIGRIDSSNPDALLVQPKVPWDDKADERGRFRALVREVAEAYRHGNMYARLEHALDTYFQMVWTLGLALPLEYIEKHPFDLTGKDLPHYYKLPERGGGTIEPLTVGPNTKVRSKANLPDTEDSVADFTVLVDGVQLARPIRFDGYPRTKALLQERILFVGRAKPDLAKIPENQRGGPLAFSGYFFFTPRVIPQEHNGLLVRINGASGTLFDPTFLKYQVAERQLSQLIAEVYVDAGLEGALNIDRESFNTAHPHYQVLANWVHNSLRLIRSKLKELRSEVLKKEREKKKKVTAANLVVMVDSLIADSTEFDPSEVPDVVLVDDEEALEKIVGEGKIAYLRSDIDNVTNPSDKTQKQWVAARVAAVARLLEAYGLLEDLDHTTQARLVAGIVKLFTIAD